MLPAVRRERIKRLILERKNLTVIEAASLLDVSEATVRRDFKRLEEVGVLSRTHGGAVIANLVSTTVSNDDLASIFVDAKRQIAARARELIRPGSCVYLDSSTTSLALARNLSDLSISVVSNSLAILQHLSTAANVNLVGVGGNMSKTRRCFVGRSAKDMLKNYHFDMVFISCRSLDMAHGISDSSDEEIDIKVTVLNRTNRLVLLADNSKFDKVSFSRICDVSDLDDLITDRKPSSEWLEFASKEGLRILWQEGGDTQATTFR